MSYYLLGWSVPNVCSSSCSECTYPVWDIPWISSLLSKAASVVIIQKSLDKSVDYSAALHRGLQDYLMGNWGLRFGSTPRLARWSYGKLAVTIRHYIAVGNMILLETEGYDSAVHRAWQRWSYGKLAVTIRHYIALGKMILLETEGYDSAVHRGWQDDLTGSWGSRFSSTQWLARWSYGKLGITIQQYTAVGRTILWEIWGYKSAVRRCRQDDLMGNWRLQFSSTPLLARWSYGKVRVMIQQYTAVGKMILGETGGYDPAVHRTWQDDLRRNCGLQLSSTPLA
jgi:hypothetical protein